MAATAAAMHELQSTGPGGNGDGEGDGIGTGETDGGGGGGGGGGGTQIGRHWPRTFSTSPTSL